MRFEQLRCLVEVADAGSITMAAKKLYVSQQAVSANIKQLEEELQVTLLKRIKNGVVLTTKGYQTVVFARKMLEETDAFYNQIRYTEEHESVMIHICSTSSVTNIVLPDVIDRYGIQKKQCSLKITLEDNLEALFEQVKNHQCDIGLLTFNADELNERFLLYQSELQLEQLVRDELIGVLNKKFFTQDVLHIKSEDFHSWRNSLYNIIPANKYLSLAQKNSVVWSNDVEFHRAMLERNNTLVLMPSLAYQFFFSNKKYIALPVENIDVPLLHAAVYRKDAPVHIQEFVDLIRLEMYMK